MAEPSVARHVLVIANRTAATPGLLAEIRRRAAEGPSRFTLLVPRTYWDADTEESAVTLELAIPLLEEATGDHVDGLIGDEDPVRAVTAALGQGNTTNSSCRRCHRTSHDGCTWICRLDSSGSGCR